ncbi:trypsin-like cysteine/serine peptidase domain-containing protein [Xylaria sp. FL0933]|nr:trypsin-like cysteine/serine peptidase domain-containing protein [Xylaria sp. FL0933]
MRYEKQSADDHAYAMGTGWLISPDMLVTAGHNVYSWAGIEGGLGRAVHINCYIGYHGRDSINLPTVQHRFAKTIVTTAEWLTSKDNRHRDVAFIQLDRPFVGNLRVFSYKPTPKAGDEMLGVVGYPADKSLADKDGREEKGALMYEMFNDIQYNLEDKKNNPLQMLKYRISTFGGQSGAPVIRKNGNQIAIATHVYGSGDKNQASAIGKYGNDYDTLLAVFTNNYPVVGSHEGISLVKPTPATSNGAAPVTPPFSRAPVINHTTSGNAEKPINGAEKFPVSKEKGSNGVEPSSCNAEKSIDGNQAEGFIEVLKSVGNVDAPAEKRTIPFDSPLFGPAGGVSSAVAGTALGAVANACAESAMEGMNTEKLIQGTAERAILAEASLQAVLRMNTGPVTDKILGHMEVIYTKRAPNVKYIGQKLAPGLLSSAYKITIDKKFIQKQHATRRLLPARPLKGNWAESSLGSNDFVDCMMQPTRPLEGEEAFFDQYSNDLVVALQTKDILLRPEAESGLLRLNKALAESSFDAESSLDSQDTQAAELVAKRAIMAEAALQAVMKLNKSELSEVQIVNDQGGVHEEGFIDIIKTAGQKIGSLVKANAIPLAKRLIPLVKDVLAAKFDPASTSASTSAAATKTARGKLAPAAPVKTLRKHRSVLSLVNDGTLKVKA